MGKTYNFAILGCGVISKTHVEALSKIENAKLLGVADVNLANATAFAEKYGIKAYQDYDQMLADEKVDVVCVCTPSGWHAPNAIQALKAGKHVVLEKPMALNTKEADEIIAISEQTGKKVTVISQFRFSADLLKVKNHIEKGDFGKISLCSLVMKYYRVPEYYSTSNWRGTLKLDGGGALINQGIHGVDMLDFLVGPITEVNGEIATLFHNIEGEDSAVATIKTQRGALGVIQASTCAYPGFDRKIEIHGDKGYAILRENKIEKMVINYKECPEEKLSLTSTSSNNTVMDYTMHKAQLENLLGAIEGKTTLVMDGNEGKRALSIIEKVYLSARQKPERTREKVR